jgi:hypothetical protein
MAIKDENWTNRSPHNKRPQEKTWGLGTERTEDIQ